MDVIKQVRSLWDRLLDTMKLYTEVSEEESTKWILSAAFKVWAANGLCSEDYITAVNGFTGGNYTQSQVMEAFEAAKKTDNKLELPEFIKKIAVVDKENASTISRNVIGSIGAILSFFANSNGDFTLGEANEIENIVDNLNSYCDSMGIPKGQGNGWIKEQITPMKKTGYFQNNPENASVSGIMDILENFSNLVNNGSDASSISKNHFAKIAGSILDDFNFNGSGNKSDNSEKITTPNTKAEEENSTEEEKSTEEKESTEGKDSEPEETLDSVMEELNSLVGLDNIKDDVKSLMNFIKVCQMREQYELKVPKVSYHLVFTGNPGTGKTTVARIVAKLYKLMGILPQGQLIETDRSGLVAGYLGQTAIKTQEVIQKAIGGVLFIDEAYSLANDDKDSYGKEAIETILKAMEDHRTELVVIVAGYDDLMHKFIDSNPGLQSRFNKYFHFEDYSGEELMKILQVFCEKNGYKIDENVMPSLKEKLDGLYENRSEHFGNARFVRNLFEQAIHCQADRIAMVEEMDADKLQLISEEDINKALELM